MDQRPDGNGGLTWKSPFSLKISARRVLSGSTAAHLYAKFFHVKLIACGRSIYNGTYCRTVAFTSGGHGIGMAFEELDICRDKLLDNALIIIYKCEDISLGSAYAGIASMR